MAEPCRAHRNAVAGLALLLAIGWISSETKPGVRGEEPADRAPAPAAVARAREQARMMHAVYASTLDVMHHHYFRINRAVLPARALEDVFSDMEAQTKVKARWIAVNTKAMSINHEPKNDFEKSAARAIAAGKEEFDRVENGVYHRAGAIPLGAGCINCHTGFFGKTPNSPRFAGLVISIPLSSD